MKPERRLIARLWHCGKTCCGFCTQVVLEEQIGDQEADRIHGGTFLSDPSSWELEMLREELAELAHGHQLEPDDLDPDAWSRTI